jgi:hypothetical protein
MRWQPSLALHWNFSRCYLDVANNRAAFMRMAASQLVCAVRSVESALTRLRTSREVGVGSPFDSLTQLLEPPFRQPLSLPRVKAFTGFPGNRNTHHLCRGINGCGPDGRPMNTWYGSPRSVAHSMRMYGSRCMKQGMRSVRACSGMMWVGRP